MNTMIRANKFPKDVGSFLKYFVDYLMLNFVMERFMHA